MNLDVSHRTFYRYSAPVIQSQHLIHMAPRSTPRQRVAHHSLIVEPAPAIRFEGTDTFGNAVVIVDLEVPHSEVVFHARTSVTTAAPEAFDPEASTPWDRLDQWFAGARTVDLGVLQYRSASRLTAASLEILDYALASFPPGRPVLAGAMHLLGRVHGEFKFDTTATDNSTPIEKVFKDRRGVCQDFAHVMLACLRALHIPARYVSGYLLTRPPPGKRKLVGVDASHAWLAVWSPEAGWTDLDPTNGIVAREEHVTVAFGRDYDDVSPISGVLLGGGTHSVTVSVDVAKVG